MILSPSAHDVATRVVPVWHIRDFYEDDLERAMHLLLQESSEDGGRPIVPLAELVAAVHAA